MKIVLILITFHYVSIFPGNAGTRGNRGSNGLDGLPGPNGNIGQTGPAGFTGSAGRPGRNGDSGFTGACSFILFIYFKIIIFYNFLNLIISFKIVHIYFLHINISFSNSRIDWFCGKCRLSWSAWLDGYNRFARKQGIHRISGEDWSNRSYRIHWHQRSQRPTWNVWSFCSRYLHLTAFICCSFKYLLTQFMWSIVNSPKMLYIAFILLPGLQDEFNDVQDDLSKDKEDIESFQLGVNQLLYGLGSWLALTTIASIVIFIVINLQLNKAARVLEDAEASECSRSSAAPSKASTRRTKKSVSRRKPSGSTHSSASQSTQSSGMNCLLFFYNNQMYYIFFY